jgi:hypothetical protein
VMTDRLPTNGRPTRRGRTASGGLVTQQEAAALAGCSRDTIARARRTGRFPHARLVDGRWMIPADDLNEAGFSPQHRTADAPTDGDDHQPANADGPAGGSSVVLASAEARIHALEDLVARQDAELCFLRRLTVDTVAKRAS